MSIRYTSPRALALAFLTAGTAVAQTNVAPAERSPRVVTAAPASDIRVDGVLDEPAWQAATPTSGFTQVEPQEGEPATFDGEVRVLRGGDALYVGAHLLDTEPASIRRPLGRRDAQGQSDRFLLALDSHNDRRTAYLFSVSAAGVLYDGFHSSGNDDDSWNAVWDGAARVVADGWVVEMRIPYSQIRFAEGDDSWGINFVREITRHDEQSFWAPFTEAQANSGIVQLFGRVDGLGGIAPRRVVQATPYLLSRARRFESSGVPGDADAAYAVDGGADLKVGLTSNTILDLTVNPDFGQVEADPAELNLSTFETFFDERRPFFLEGTQIFNLDVGNNDGALLYTRRIGGSSRLLGAAKLSGQTAGGIEFGALAAVTGHDVDPDRAYGMLRATRRFGTQNTVGAGFTAFDYTPNDDDPSLGVRAFAGAADWDIRLGQNEGFKLDGALAGSHRSVDGADASTGYALHIGFDRVLGWFTPGTGIRVYSPDFQINDVGRFRQSDIIQAVLGGNYIFNRGQPVGPYRRLNLGVGLTQTWRYTDGANRGAEMFFFGGGDLRNFHSLSVNGGASGLGGWDVRETRGLGPVDNIGQANVSFEYGTDERRRVRFYPGFYVGAAFNGATDFTPFAYVDWVASDRLALSLNTFYEVRDGWRAWAANEGLVRTPDGLFIGASGGPPGGLDPSELEPLVMTTAEIDALLAGVEPSTDPSPVAGGVGYYVPVFGTRDTRQLRLTARANWLFSPNLSLQLYANALTARGRLDGWQLLAAPDDLRDFDAYPKRRDFSQEAFNANVVLRWEYRPGSTLFVVWTQGRGAFLEEELLLNPLSPAPTSPFDRTTGNQLGDLFEHFPDNVLLVKLNYLLMR